MWNVLLLELLFELQQLEFATSTKRNRTGFRRKITRTALPGCVNQLGAEVTDGNIEATDAVVVEDMLDGKNRSVLWTYRQPRGLRRTRSVKLGKSSWNQP